jgi:hypothetical protein
MFLYGEPSEIVLPIKFPFTIKLDGLNIIVIYILNFKLIVKLDSRRTPEWFKPLAAKAQRPFVAAAYKYRESPDFNNDVSGLRDTLSKVTDW